MHPQLQEDVHEALERLMSYLEKEYYTRIEAHCSTAAGYISELLGTDTHQTTSLYTSLSEKLIGQVGQYIRLRRHALMPYIQELLEKEESGHDCRSCSSSCTIRHTAQISGIREAHAKMRETLGGLRSVASPMLEGLAEGSVRHNLNAEMTKLDTVLTALFHGEESLLIPKILEAQGAIHAHS